MKKNILTIGILSAVTVVTSAYIIKDSTGKSGRVGSPGESTCAGCHGGGSGTTMVSVSFNPAITSGSYVPNQTYTVTVNVINNPFSKFGFACEILNSSNANSGTMANAGPGVTFLTAGNGRKSATHSTPKTGTGSAQFTFGWTAPTSGAVTLYAIGNAVNGNGGTSGDTPSSTYTLTLNPDVTAVPLASESINHVVVYPNPVKENLHIQINASQNLANTKVHLTDLSGKTIYSTQLSNITSGINDISIILPEFVKSGIYLLNITNENQKISKLVLIEK